MEHHEEFIISTYTDEEALLDGVLWSVTHTDRMTSNLAVQLENLANVDNSTIIDYARRWLATYGASARRIYHYNLEGGIWAGNIYLSPLGDLQLEASPGLSSQPTNGLRVWILPNELGGLTLMLPEDY